MTNAERETIIRWDRESDTATVYTADPSFAGKLRKMGWTLTVVGRLKGDEIGWQGPVPKAMIKVRKNAPSLRKGNPDALRKARSTRPGQPIDGAEGV